METKYLFPRKIVPKIKEWLDKPEIIVLLGARQAGKTSIMELIMQELPPEQCLFLDLKDTCNLQIVSDPSKFIGFLKVKGLFTSLRTYVFLDEIQYLPAPDNFLKLIQDQHPQVKLIVSGSSSFEIRQKTSDALTGRKIVFPVHPLNFVEYLAFKKSEYAEIKDELNLETILADFTLAEKYNLLTPKIKPLFEDFVIYGGYPAAVLTDNNEHKTLRLKAIHNSYIFKDIQGLVKTEHIVQFNQLVSYLAAQTGGLLNLHNISKETGLKRTEIEKYVFLLENTFLLNLVEPFFQNRQKELTKMNKLYFNDNGLRNINVNDFRTLELRPDQGVLMENVFCQELLKRENELGEIKFWRTKLKQDVDFVVVGNSNALMPVEILYHSFNPELPAYRRVPAYLRTFIDKFNPSRTVIITQDFLHQQRFRSTELFFVPLWMA